MARAASLSLLLLAACGPHVPPQPRGPMMLDDVAYDVTRTRTGGVLVRRVGRPFQNWEGAEARRGADAFCNGRAQTSDRDRFRGDAWLIVEGCA